MSEESGPGPAGGPKRDDAAKVNGTGSVNRAAVNLMMRLHFLTRGQQAATTLLSGGTSDRAARELAALVSAMGRHTAPRTVLHGPPRADERRDRHGPASTSRVEAGALDLA
jgi:hypothetical protein